MIKKYVEFKTAALDISKASDEVWQECLLNKLSANVLYTELCLSIINGLWLFKHISIIFTYITKVLLPLFKKAHF